MFHVMVGSGMFRSSVEFRSCFTAVLNLGMFHDHKPIKQRMSIPFILQGFLGRPSLGQDTKFRVTSCKKTERCP